MTTRPPAAARLALVAAVFAAALVEASGAHSPRVLAGSPLASRPPPLSRARVAARRRSAVAPAPRAVLSAPVIAAGVGGSLAGGLHALTGPDHVACVLPICVGRRWWSAVYTGAYWGLGHGIGATAVGALGYFVKGYLNLDALATWGEVAVGVSILVIGVLGLREAAEWREHATAEVEEALEEAGVTTPVPAAEGGADGGEVRAPSAAAIAAAGGAAFASPSLTSSLLTGILHGCSGSGHLLGVLPALAMPSGSCAAAYLGMFGVGASARAGARGGCERGARGEARREARAPHAPSRTAPSRSRPPGRRHDARHVALHRCGRRDLSADGRVPGPAGHPRQVRARPGAWGAGGGGGEESVLGGASRPERRAAARAQPSGRVRCARACVLTMPTARAPVRRGAVHRLTVISSAFACALGLVWTIRALSVGPCRRAIGAGAVALGQSLRRALGMRALA